MKYIISNRVFLAATLLLISSSLKAQQKFELFHLNKKDSTLFFIKNNSNDTINGVSLNATWFHMGEGLLFWPTDKLTGLSISKTAGKYMASDIMFKFKSYQRMSFDFFVPPGESQLFATVVNYVNTADTIMCANVQLWYLDDNDSLHNEKVLPSNTNPGDCVYEQYYLVSNLGKSDGVKWGSPANYTLHRSNQCTNGLAIVIIDRNSLKPKPINGITPNCSDGRKWTTFGYPTDEQVYYYFDTTDTSRITQIIKLIEAVPNGDHVFISTLGTVETDFRSIQMKNALKLIGASGNETINELHSFKTLCAFGSKGAPAGTLYAQAIQPMQSSVYTLREYILFPGKFYDSANAFSSCYEKGISVIMPEQPKQNNSNQIAYRPIHWRVFPNPVTYSNEIRVYIYSNLSDINSKPEGIQLYNSFGQLIPFHWKFNENNQVELTVNNPTPGVYFLRINNQIQKLLVN